MKMHTQRKQRERTRRRPSGIRVKIQLGEAWKVGPALINICFLYLYVSYQNRSRRSHNNLVLNCCFSNFSQISSAGRTESQCLRHTRVGVFLSVSRFRCLQTPGFCRWRRLPCRHSSPWSSRCCWFGAPAGWRIPCPRRDWKNPCSGTLAAAPN
jgi:hypothetical protein